MKEADAKIDVESLVGKRKRTSRNIMGQYDPNEQKEGEIIDGKQ